MRLFFLSISGWMILLSALSSAPAFADANRDENLRRLEQIEERLNEALVAIEQKKSTEVDLLSELDDVEWNLRQKKQRVSASNKRLEELKKNIQIQQKELTKRQKEVEKLQGKVRERLISLYKSEESGTMKTLFSAESAFQLLEDYDFLGRIVVHDRELLVDYRQRLKKRQEAINQLAVSKKRQQQILTALQSEEDELRQTLKLKNRFLVAVRRDRSALDSMVVELRKRAARVTSLVQGLESGKAADDSGKVPLFPLQKGLLPWPVKGEIKVNFGTKKHPELGTLIESHGMEIYTAIGTPIRAVWHGRVAFAKRFKGYGNLLIVDHEDGYYTLYAQAASLSKKAGDTVKKGDTLAVSGYDGADFVYFEIRQGSTPLDPIGWVAQQ